MLSKKIHKIGKKQASLYINQHVSFKRLTRYEEYGIECVWLEVKMKKSSPILVGFLYRNPSEPANWVDKKKLYDGLSLAGIQRNYFNGRLQYRFIQSQQIMDRNIFSL